MRSNHVLFGRLIFLMMIILMITGGCKQQYSLESTWLDKEITIDGIDKDWKENRRYYDETSNTRISIYNDNESLYICLIAMDPDIQRSIQRRGLTLWLCQPGKSEKVWGLRYPMAQDFEGKPDFGGYAKPETPGEPRGGDNEQQGQWGDNPVEEREEEGRMGAPGDAHGPGGTPPFGNYERDVFGKVIDGDFQLFDSGDEKGRIFSSDEIADFGILCSFSRTKGAGLVYEIKIPLNRAEKTPYAACLSPKKRVTIGFVTEKKPGGRDRKKGGMRRGGSRGGGGDDGGMGGKFPRSGGMDGGMGGGGMRGDGMGGKRDMGRGPMGGPRAEAIEIWADVELSSAPALNK